MKITTILDQIDMGSMALPEFQRGYVWNRDQVRGLMYSLYKKYPVGSLMVWTTKTENAEARGDGELAPGTVKLLLDGQQRITSLYGIIRGKPPKFFDGNAQAFTGLYFNLDDESFEFYAPLKMKDNPSWISVTDLMKVGSGQAIQKIVAVPASLPNLQKYINRLTAIDGIKEIDLHIEEVTGEDKTVDVVVDIFNRVNSGGTKLSKGDLALAKICAEWPHARDEMKKRLTKWRKAGFDFRLDWLLRVINANATGEALFSALAKVSTQQFRDAVPQSEKAVDTVLNSISSRLGLDHDRVLGSKGALPLMTRYLVQRGGKLPQSKERDQLLFWYVHTFLWGRYSGQTESVLNIDLEAIEKVTPTAYDEGLKTLMEGLRRDRGDLKLNETDFRGASKGSRFYPLLYMMTRMGHALDWGTGDKLANHLLGYLSRLQVHHIFPKALLYKHGYKRRQVNAVANFTFLTQETNLVVSKRDPSEYIPAFEKLNTGAVATHWIPMDPELWKVENYEKFLAERRKLLAAAGNDLLKKLFAGDVPEPVAVPALAAPGPASPIIVPGDIDSEDEETSLRACNDWLVGQGLPAGELAYELSDPKSGTPVANLDLAWPNGLQEGLSQPVALLIDEEPDVEEIANKFGFRFFTSVEDFKEYVLSEVLASTAAST